MIDSSPTIEAGRSGSAMTWMTSILVEEVESIVVLGFVEIRNVTPGRRIPNHFDGSLPQYLRLEVNELAEEAWVGTNDWTLRLSGRITESHEYIMIMYLIM